MVRCSTTPTRLSQPAPEPSRTLDRCHNSDGKPDIVVANSGKNNVSVLLNNGNATFGTPASITVGTNPYHGVADFNADAKRDVAVVNSGSSNLSLLLGTGSGGFGAPSSVTSGTTPYSLAIADPFGDEARIAFPPFLRRKSRDAEKSAPHSRRKPNSPHHPPIDSFSVPVEKIGSRRRAERSRNRIGPPAERPANRSCRDRQSPHTPVLEPVGPSHGRSRLSKPEPRTGRRSGQAEPRD